MQIFPSQLLIRLNAWKCILDITILNRTSAPIHFYSMGVFCFFLGGGFPEIFFFPNIYRFSKSPRHVTCPCWWRNVILCSIFDVKVYVLKAVHSLYHSSFHRTYAEAMSNLTRHLSAGYNGKWFSPCLSRGGITLLSWQLVRFFFFFFLLPSLGRVINFWGVCNI